MDRTINGKTLKQVFEDLAQDLPEEVIQSRSFDNVAYINVDDYRNRVNEVLGADHYDERYHNTTIEKIGDTAIVRTECTIVLLDDAYEPIKEYSRPGATNIIFLNTEKVGEDGKVVMDEATKKPVMVKSDTPRDIANNISTACQDAFKRICKNDFLIGKRQLDTLKKGEVFELTIIGTPYEKNGHRFFTCKTEKGEDIKLAVFKNKAQEFDKAFPEPVSGSVVFVTGKDGADSFGKRQLIFDKADKKGSSTKNKKEKAQELTLKVKSKTAVLERKSKPGDFSMQVIDSKGKTRNVVIPKDTVESIGAETWGKFVIRCADVASPTEFSMVCVETKEENREIFLMKSFGRS